MATAVEIVSALSFCLSVCLSLCLSLSLSLSLHSPSPPPPPLSLSLSRVRHGSSAPRTCAASLQWTPSLCAGLISGYMLAAGGLLCDGGLTLNFHHLVGLVVKAFASRAEDPGFESRLRRDLFGVESYQWLQNWHSSGYPARRLAL